MDPLFHNHRNIGAVCGDEQQVMTLRHRSLLQGKYEAGDRALSEEGEEGNWHR